MKNRIISLIVALSTCFTMHSQSVSFGFDGSSLANIPFNVATTEANISSLLTEINRADRTRSSLNLSSINMEDNAKAKLHRFWANMHFSCDDSSIKQKCMQDAQGYQVRNINVTLHPLDDTYHGRKNKTIVISFNRSGRITGVRTALDSHDYASVMGEGGRVVEDERQRLEILKFVEDFRNYYNDKDTSSLRKIFSEDALIITGSVIKMQTRGEVKAQTNKIIYKQTDRETYLKNLQGIFNRNRFVDVAFDEITVKRNGASGKERFFGVTLKQKWHTDHYSDEGYVFLLWEFRDNGEPPIIHVRAWQPDKYADGKPMKQDDILDMNDFKIP
ncbi:MAG: nuclear transport factor 2 family protein [Prevotellaceae bacterium]|nr:nuclear transport factor 2 family protein [Candidatus Minthosoma caballi]